MQIKWTLNARGWNILAQEWHRKLDGRKNRNLTKRTIINHQRELLWWFSKTFDRRWQETIFAIFCHEMCYFYTGYYCKVSTRLSWISYKKQNVSRLQSILHQLSEILFFLIIKHAVKLIIYCQNNFMNIINCKIVLKN